METNPSIHAPLPVIRIIGDAFLFVWNKRTRFLFALAVPVVLLLIVDRAVTLENNDPLKFVQAFFQMAIYILFAITCHRIALMGDEAVPHFGLRRWTLRESRYLGWSVIIFVIWLLFSFVVNSFYVSMVVSQVEAGARPETYQSYKYWLAPFYIPVLYILSRLSVLCPAIALDQKVDAQWVWRLTVHNGWRLTLVVSLLPWVLYFVLNLLLRENASLTETIIVQLLGFIVLAVEVVALSFSYQHLAQAEA
jgi:hypothetical protein